MEQLAATSVLSLFDTNKEQRKTFVDSIISRIELGTANPLNIHIQIKSMEDIIDNLLESKIYKEYVLVEAEKYGGKRFEFGNAEVAVKETGVRYDYSNCNDQEHTKRLIAFEYSKKMLDEREAFLKKIPTEGIGLLTSEGELIRIYPPAKSSTTSTVVTLK